MKYLLPDGNIIIASPDFIAERYSDAVLIEEPPAAPAPPTRIITEYAFRQRFTPAEKVALYTAAKTDIELQIWLDDIRAADHIDLDYPPLVAGVEAVEAAGLIAAGRADEILEREPAA